MAFMLIVFNVTKHEEECHILNQFLLFRMKIIFYM